MKIDRKNVLLCIIALTLLTIGGCSENSTEPDVPAFAGDAETVQISVVTDDGFTRYDGVIGGRNLYAFLVPDDWNGDSLCVV